MNPCTGEERAAFERSFVTVGYLLGRREAELLTELDAPLPATLTLARELTERDREGRARVLARELLRLSAALDRRRLG